MELEITDKIALVTGASRGIGLEVCKNLAREGVRVIAVSRSIGLLETIDNQNFFLIKMALRQLFQNLTKKSLYISIAALEIEVVELPNN